MPKTVRELAVMNRLSSEAINSKYHISARHQQRQEGVDFVLLARLQVQFNCATYGRWYVCIRTLSVYGSV